MILNGICLTISSIKKCEKTLYLRGFSGFKITIKIYRIQTETTIHRSVLISFIYAVCIISLKLFTTIFTTTRELFDFSFFYNKYTHKIRGSTIILCLPLKLILYFLIIVNVNFYSTANVFF